MLTVLVFDAIEFQPHVIVIAKVGLKCFCFDAFGLRLLDNLLRGIGCGIVVYCSRAAQCCKRKTCGFSHPTCRTRN
jgi:hypothetical protein